MSIGQQFIKVQISTKKQIRENTSLSYAVHLVYSSSCNAKLFNSLILLKSCGSSRHCELQAMERMSTSNGQEHKRVQHAVPERDI